MDRMEVLSPSTNANGKHEPENIPHTFMQYHIWRHLIQMLSFREDLNNIISPFLLELKNNHNKEQYNINEKEYIPFLQSLSIFQLEVLHKYKIINEEIYANIVQNYAIEKTVKSSEDEEKIVESIIKGDNHEELQKLIREKSIEKIRSITKSFNEVKKMRIPIIIESIIHKAIKCFKYLLINGIEDPTNTMDEQNPKTIRMSWYNTIEVKRYEWDCMATAIYYGEVEIMTILEEKGIEKGNKPSHIEAALLSYRNSIAKTIINNMKEEKKENEYDENILKIGLFASNKSNNIKGTEILISTGADINAKDIIYQIIILLFLNNII